MTPIFRLTQPIIMALTKIVASWNCLHPVNKNLSYIDASMQKKQNAIDLRLLCVNTSDLS